MMEKHENVMRFNFDYRGTVLTRAGRRKAFIHGGDIATAKLRRHTTTQHNGAIDPNCNACKELQQAVQAAQ